MIYHDKCGLRCRLQVANRDGRASRRSAGCGRVRWMYELTRADTSYTLWQFCMKHPGITDVCELAALLFVSHLAASPGLRADFDFTP